MRIIWDITDLETGKKYTLDQWLGIEEEETEESEED